METSLNLSKKIEIVTRPEMHYIFLQKIGPFMETAPAAWHEMYPLTHGKIEQNKVVATMALCAIEKDKQGHDIMIYEAGLGLSEEPRNIPKGLQYKKVRSGQYARFVLTGSYSQLSRAWPEAFRILEQEKIKIRKDFAIENYLNDASVTPEEKLLTEILIPVA
ncbi:MAG TPA: GyrI-like domain-containing protein [Bdellovibrio sp.]|nr:GyrI-like domain-containing protein [Bdellovibrio sp.]